MIGTQNEAPLVQGDGSADNHKLACCRKLYQIYCKMHECSDLFNMQNNFVSITLHTVSVSSGCAQISQCGFSIFLSKHFSAFKLCSHNYLLTFSFNTTCFWSCSWNQDAKHQAFTLPEALTSSKHVHADTSFRLPFSFFSSFFPPKSIASINVYEQD